MPSYRVLILGLTKAGKMLCAGGLTDKYEGIRLIQRGQYPFWYPESCPFFIGHWFLIDGERQLDPENPHHCENVLVEKFVLSKQFNKQEMFDFFKRGNVVQHCNLPTRAFRFTGYRIPFRRTTAGAFRIQGQDLSLLLQSTAFWENPHPLRFQDGRYHCAEDDYNIKYVGLAAPVPIIPAKSIIRLSTSAYWDELESSFMQLSGWFV